MKDGPSIPPFDADVPNGGYRWWYVDGLSDCGNFGVVVIAFIGSVFSPYYYRSKRRSDGDPYQHCAINVALYGPRRNRWAMTERTAKSLHLERDSFYLGRSSLVWSGDKLGIAVDERSAPFGQALRGRIELTAPTMHSRQYKLDAAGQHVWQPIAPCAQIALSFDEPRLGWKGNAYFDHNAGRRPLERDFRGWDWSRLQTERCTTISYSVLEAPNTRRSLALRYGHDGTEDDVPLPSAVDIGRTRWGVQRFANLDGTPSVHATLEDTPFYARTMLQIDDENGSRAHAMHESLSLDRFNKPWVRTLLPFRMPRRSGGPPAAAREPG